VSPRKSGTAAKVVQSVASTGYTAAPMPNNSAVSVRRLGASLVMLAGLALLLVVPATAARQGALPDPCSAVSSGAVNTAFGASSDTPEFGTSGSAKSHGVAAKTCSWTYAAARLVVTVAPKTYKPAAWPGGTKQKAAAGLGAGAKLATNTRPGTTFVAVTFTKGSHFGEVWVSGGTGTASVLKLAKQVYAKL